MLFDYRAYWLAKDVRRGVEYEDAFRVDEDRGVAAIADGVSSSFQSGPWANLLVKHIVQDPPNLLDAQAFSHWLGGLRKEWVKGVNVESLAWHQKAKLQEGAATTLLVLEIYPADLRDKLARGAFHMKVYAVGDCCLFHCREGQVIRTYPMEQSSDLDAHPAVIRSKLGAGEPPVAFSTLVDYCEVGDLLVLCTDAVAGWGLRMMEAGHNPGWDGFWDITETQWEQWVQQCRQQQQLRFDDATLVLLRVTGGAVAGKRSPALEQPLPGTNASTGNSTASKPNANDARGWKEEVKKQLDALPDWMKGK